MALSYDPVHWTPHKRLYDRILIAFIGVYLLIFIGLQSFLHPTCTIETTLIRATGTLGFFMLHLILIIGPLCRLDRRFLPLLYNRRHFGVAMFLVALVHGVFNLFQFHAMGNVDPMVSLFTSNTQYGSLARFPFQSLGFFALLILFLMAATSHDFWLKNLGPRVWKSLHMSVYFAYALLIMHVMLGVIQLEKSPVLIGMVGLGMFMVIGFHVAAAIKQSKTDAASERNATIKAILEVPEGFVYACEWSEISNNKAKMLIIGKENIALFRYEDKISAVHNLCKHQNGPLSEGRIIDGCITCPWHGYQYLPENGQSPPPFTEKLATYDVLVNGSSVYINPSPFPEGTARNPAQISMFN